MVECLSLTLAYMSNELLSAQTSNWKDLTPIYVSTFHFCINMHRFGLAVPFSLFVDCATVYDTCKKFEKHETLGDFVRLSFVIMTKIRTSVPLVGSVRSIEPVGEHIPFTDNDSEISQIQTFVIKLFDSTLSDQSLKQLILTHGIDNFLNKCTFNLPHHTYTLIHAYVYGTIWRFIDLLRYKMIDRALRNSYLNQYDRISQNRRQQLSEWFFTYD